MLKDRDLHSAGVVSVLLVTIAFLSSRCSQDRKVDTVDLREGALTPIVVATESSLEPVTPVDFEERFQVGPNDSLEEIENKVKRLLGNLMECIEISREEGIPTASHAAQRMNAWEPPFVHVRGVRVQPEIKVSNNLNDHGLVYNGDVFCAKDP